MKVSEKFYSIQGEGMSSGVPAFFIRLAGCNLLCGGMGTDKDGQLHDGATWRCDTIEVWQHGKTLNIDDLAFEYLQMPPYTHLVITGGEPLLQQREIIKLIERIPMNRTVEIETNGTLMPDLYLLQRVQWNVSPKLSNSGMAENKRINASVINKLCSGDFDVQFKFVIKDEADYLMALEDFIKPYHISELDIWVMPAAETREQLIEVAPAVIEVAKKYGVKYSNRTHIQVWDKKTGV